MMSRERGVLVKLSEMELKALIQGGETNTVELKVAAPRATEMAERLCGMANAQGGVVIIGVKDSTHEIVGASTPWCIAITAKAARACACFVTRTGRDP
jgi:predicted HTH transcriptional regulator